VRDLFELARQEAEVEAEITIEPSRVRATDITVADTGNASK
jgi:hypothetical protein